MSALAVFFIGIIWGPLLAAALASWIKSHPRCESLVDEFGGKFSYRCAHKSGHTGPHESPGGMVHWR